MYKSLRYRKSILMLYSETVDNFDLNEFQKDIDNHGKIHMDCKKKDMTAAILFLSFVASMFEMCIYDFVAGDPHKMFNPYDGKIISAAWIQDSKNILCSSCQFGFGGS